VYQTSKQEACVSKITVTEHEAGVKGLEYISIFILEKPMEEVCLINE
jgi:hypothetical protein